jgi:hypothetical protein
MDSKIMNMRKILFITILFCGLAFTANSQTLEFSQVLLVSSLDTVPQGKVWKVTNILPTLEGSGSSKIQVNGNDIVVAFSMSSNGQTNHTGNFGNNHNYYNALQGSYWLPEGTTLQASTNVQYISVIEFNE